MAGNRYRLKAKRKSGFVISQNPLRTIITQNVMSLSSSSIANTTSHSFYWPFIVAQDSSSILLNFLNWYGANTPGEIASGNDYSIVSCSIQLNGVSAPVTFAGLRTKTILNGATDINSDEILASAFSLDRINTGRVGFMKGTLRVSTAGFKFPISNVDRRNYSGVHAAAQAWFYNEASTTMVNDVDTLGAFTSSGTAPGIQNAGYRPFVLGRPVKDNASVIVIGDSIMAGIGDFNSVPAPGNSGTGYFQRALEFRTGQLMPSMNFGRPGDTISTRLGTNTLWISYIKYAKHAVEEFGTNDVRFDTNVNIQARKISAWAILRTNGIQTIIVPYLLPITTGSWSDSAGQTATVQSGVGGQTDQMNAWYLSKLGSGIDYIIYADTNVRDPVETQKWAYDAVLTTDGTHPNNIAVERILPFIKSVWAQLA